MSLEIFTSRSRAENPFPSSEYHISQHLRFPDDSGIWRINDLFAPPHAYSMIRDMSMEFLLCAIYLELICYPKYPSPAPLISHSKEDFVLKVETEFPHLIL